ncbi:GINS_subunit [Hexamita inflata]|uniref:Domain A n=1 Tax=Hexamita inflata TaxID=28002 RepID=A0AA86PEG0_9EUKA|nr:GINS subunit [Hexamita inflata]
MSAITLQNMLDEKVQFKSSVSINQRMDLFNMELNNIRLANITEIPLYLALLLTKQHKGYIIIPEYMKEQYLQEKIVEESGIGFSKINDHFTVMGGGIAFSCLLCEQLYIKIFCHFQCG